MRRIRNLYYGIGRLLVVRTTAKHTKRPLATRLALAFLVFNVTAESSMFFKWVRSGDFHVLPLFAAAFSLATFYLILSHRR